MRKLAVAIVGVAMLAAPNGAQAQQPDFPPIESIDFYGLRTVAEARAREVLEVTEGDPIPQTPPTAEELAEAFGVARVTVSVVCCGEAGGTLIYVGVDEEGGASPTYRPAPTGDARLPDDVVAAYEAFTQSLLEAVRTGQAGEDRSQGHALSEHPGMRAAQEQFLVFAERDGELLLEVLSESSDPQHRAIAAHVLGYVADKPAVVEPLSEAMFDSFELVRNNATRALAVMAVYANETPGTGIVIDPEPYIGMLDSVVFSDRNKGVALLDSLTVSRDPELMAELRERSVPALVEMCRWKSWGHALSACLILQRALGLPDDGDVSSREPTLAAAAALLEAGGPSDGGG